MPNRWRCLLVCAAALGAHQAAAQSAPAAIPSPSARAMDAHLRYLADDLLEGRGPGTRGGALAARYIAAQFEALGLDAAGPDGSYFQPVALVGMKPAPELSWTANAQTRTLRYGDDFVAWAETPDSAVSVPRAEVVFVGYGIQAPEWRWDDYRGLDARGKVLMMLVNDPEPSDQYTDAFTYDGMVQEVRVAMRLAIAVANAPLSRPGCRMRNSAAGEDRGRNARLCLRGMA